MTLCRFGGVSALLVATGLLSTGFSAGAATTNYVGLIYSGRSNASAESGSFTLSVSPNRNFSGRISIARTHAGFSGRFNTNGAADVVATTSVDDSCYSCDPPIIDIETKGIWDVYFQLSPSQDSISGGLHIRSGGFPDGTVYGKRSSFGPTHKVPSAGNFTFVLAGSGDPADTTFPTGNGGGTITIGSSGTVTVGGSLADRSTFAPGTLLCDDGTFPAFVSLYDGIGMIQGWVGLTNSPIADLSGEVVWARPARLLFYPAGFTNEVALAGSRYVKTSPLLDWTNGVVIFQGGNLSAPFTNDIRLKANGTVANLSSNKLSLTIQPKSGQFSGTAKEPLTGRSIPFSGVLVQKQRGGVGYFPVAPLSGEVLLGPAAP